MIAQTKYAIERMTSAGLIWKDDFYVRTHRNKHGEFGWPTIIPIRIKKNLAKWEQAMPKLLAQRFDVIKIVDKGTLRNLCIIYCGSGTIKTIDLESETYE